MKKLILIIILASTNCVTNAQINEGNFSISLTHKVAVNHTKLMRSNLTGIEAEWMVSDNVGFNYSVYGGEGVLHMPAGPLLGLAALGCVAGASGHVDPDVIPYILAIPEGVTYNIEVAPNTYVSPYVNPMGLEIQTSGGKKGDFVDRNTYQSTGRRVYLMGATGTKIKMFMPISNDVHVVFSAFAETQLEYTSDQKLGVRAGFSAGISF